LGQLFKLLGEPGGSTQFETKYEENPHSNKGDFMRDGKTKGGSGQPKRLERIRVPV